MQVALQVYFNNSGKLITANNSLLLVDTLWVLIIPQYDQIFDLEKPNYANVDLVPAMQNEVGPSSFVRIHDRV